MTRKLAQCPHLRKQMGRVIIADGRTQVAERCLDCFVRLSGWVPRSYLRMPLEDLPLFEDMRERKAPDGPRQLDLFQ